MTARIHLEAFGKSLNVCISLDTLALQTTFLDSIASLLNVVESRFDIDADVKTQEKQFIIDRIRLKRNEINALKSEAFVQHRINSETKSLKATKLSPHQENSDADQLQQPALITTVSPTTPPTTSRMSSTGLPSSQPRAGSDDPASPGSQASMVGEVVESRGWKLPNWMRRRQPVSPAEAFDEICGTGDCKE